jgi:hypothetical protein
VVVTRHCLELFEVGNGEPLWRAGRDDDAAACDLAPVLEPTMW